MLKPAFFLNRLDTKVYLSLSLSLAPSLALSHHLKSLSKLKAKSQDAFDVLCRSCNKPHNLTYFISKGQEKSWFSGLGRLQASENQKTCDPSIADSITHGSINYMLALSPLLTLERFFSFLQIAAERLHEDKQYKHVCAM